MLTESLATIPSIRPHLRILKRTNRRKTQRDHRDNKTRDAALHVENARPAHVGKRPCNHQTNAGRPSTWPTLRETGDLSPPQLRPLARIAP